MIRSVVYMQISVVSMCSLATYVLSMYVLL